MHASFDLEPLIQALQSYVNNYDALVAAHNRLDYAARNRATMELNSAWIQVGKAQRDVPAHVAQEYCRPDRAFYPCPPFNEPELPRILTFHNWVTSRRSPGFL